MKCVVTGATGFVGKALCSALIEAGHQLVPWSRSGAAVCLASGQTIPSCAVELRQTITPESLSDVEVVIHLAGIAHQRATEKDYDEVNYDATLRLARAAFAAGVGHFVFVSSVKAMGSPRSDTPRSEDDCHVPDDAYGLSKWRAESALRREFGGSSLRLSIIRPALVYGAGARGNLQLLARGVKLGLPRPPAGGQRSCIAVDDVAEILCRAAASPPRSTRTWIACAESYSTQQVYDLLRIANGKRVGLAWLPRWGWYLAAAGLDVLQRNRQQSTFNKLFAPEVYSNARVLSESGWRARHSLHTDARALLEKVPL